MEAFALLLKWIVIHISLQFGYYPDELFINMI